MPNPKNPYQKKTELVKKGGEGVSVFGLKVKKKKEVFFASPYLTSPQPTVSSKVCHRSTAIVMCFKVVKVIRCALVKSKEANQMHHKALLHISFSAS